MAPKHTKETHFPHTADSPPPVEVKVARRSLLRRLIPGAVAGHRHPHEINIKLHDVNQLFNSMDPSPFVDKDLDDDAEEFIVSWAQEFAPDAPVTLRIYLDQWPDEDPEELVKDAVHNHFARRANLNHLAFRRLMKQGRDSLFVGLVFLSACLFASQMLLRSDPGTWANVLRQSLTIAGWVAMWRPMEIYLYEWWPVRRRGRVFAKLSRMPVEVIPKTRA